MKTSNPVRLRDDWHFSYNKNLINKPKEDDKCDFISFFNTSGTIDDLIYIIKKGIAFAPCTFRGTRNKKNVIASYLWVGDIDNGLSLQDALENEFIKNYCLVYTSPSHSEETNKYRLISFLPVSLDNQEYEALGYLLNKKIGGFLDPNAMEAGHLFYGCNYAQWFNLDPLELPFELILEARKLASETQEIEEIAREKRQNSEFNLSDNETKSIALEALSKIPSKELGDGRYEEMRSVGTALINIFGLDDAISLMDNHSWCGVNYWQKKLKTCTGNFGLGTILYVAGQYGYVPPKKDNFSLESFIQWKRDEYARFSKFSPDIIFNEQYIDDKMRTIEIEGKITAIKSPMNTGKSYWLKSLKNKQLLILGNRRLLTQQLAGKLCISYIDEFFDNDLAQSAVFGGESTSIVIDSLKKLQGVDFTGITLVVDEAQQVLESLQIAKTHIKNIRGTAWAILAQIAKQCESIILMDANLSDSTCEYFSRLCEKPTAKIFNQYSEAKGKNREAFFYNDVDKLYGQLKNALESRKKVLVVSDSQEELTALNELFNDGYNVLITRPALGNFPDDRRFIENNGLAIKTEKVDMVLASPVIQSGVSLEIGDYFDYVFGIFKGVVDSSDARQMLMRDRSNAPRHVFACNYGVGYANRFSWKELRESHTLNDEYLLDAIHYFEQVKSLTRSEAVAKVSELMNSQDNLLNLNQEYIAKVTAKGNINRSMFRELLMMEMESDGYECKNNDFLFGGFIKSLNQIKKDLRECESVAIANATEIDEVKANFLTNQPNLNDHERRQLIKHKISKFLPDFDVTSPFVLEYIIKDKFKTLLGIQNYFLVQNAEIAKMLDFNSISHALNDAHEGGVFYVSSRRYSLLEDIWNSLNLGRLTGAIVATSVMENIINSIPLKIRNILRGFGIRWNQNSYATKTLKSIFNLFGFTLSFSKQNKEREYLIKPIELVRGKQIFDSIFKSIKSKYSTDLEVNKEVYELILREGAKTQIEYNIEPPTQQPNDNILNFASVGISNTYIEGDTGQFSETDFDEGKKDDFIDWNLIDKIVTKYINQPLENIWYQLEDEIKGLPNDIAQLIADKVMSGC